MTYVQKQIIEGTAAIEFGKQVAIEGYYVLTSDNSTNGYFYRRQSNGGWSQINTFTMPASTASFGNALSIGNEYFVSGDPGFDSFAGRAGIYAISDPSILIQTLAPSGLATGDNFGSAIVINDNYIFVGAPNSDTNRGDVYLYIKEASATWTAYSGNPITSGSRATNSYFGGAVAINENTLIIGAEGDNNKTGAVYIFELNRETSLWEETQKIFASDGVENDQFGESLSSSGNYFVAGASLAESAAGDINAGAAYVYKRGGEWYEVDKLEGTDESSYNGNHFGTSVCINGNYIIIGSPGARGGQGVADIFYKKRRWNHFKKLVTRGRGDTFSNGEFGYSVSISHSFAVASAPKM